MYESQILLMFILLQLVPSMKGDLYNYCTSKRYSMLISSAGTLFQPTAYTLPDGLRSENGSNITGGCQESCVMMPISGTTTNGCDCPGTTPVSGVLIDGDIPSIDTTQRGTWASGLFVVNRNGQNSFVIGFEFFNSLLLRELEVTYFDCPLWGAGVTTINVYSSFVYPTFLNAASTNIGVLSPVGDTSPSCTSLRTISIPVQSTESTINYFIQFSFTGGSTVNSLNWLHLGEIRFSDVALTTTTTPDNHTTTGFYNPLIGTQDYHIQFSVGIVEDPTTEPATTTTEEQPPRTTVTASTDDQTTTSFTTTEGTTEVILRTTAQEAQPNG